MSGYSAPAQDRTPLYHRIFLVLRNKIEDGEYQEGEYLPSEREIEAEYGVSRITAVRALNELAAVGLVVREQGRGTRVQFFARGAVARGPRVSASGEAVTIGSVDELINALNKRSPGQVTLHAFDYVPAPGHVAQALGLAERTPVQCAVRVWRFQGRPFNHLTTYVPADLGRSWTRADLERTPLINLLERAGAAPASILERISATLADAVVAERLEIDVGAPVMRIVREAAASDGRPVEYMVGLYVPDRYQYSVSLDRDGVALSRPALIDKSSRPRSP